MRPGTSTAFDANRPRVLHNFGGHSEAMFLEGRVLAWLTLSPRRQTGRSAVGLFIVGGSQQAPQSDRRRALYRRQRIAGRWSLGKQALEQSVGRAYQGHEGVGQDEVSRSRGGRSQREPPLPDLWRGGPRWQAHTSTLP